MLLLLVLLYVSLVSARNIFAILKDEEVLRTDLDSGMDPNELDPSGYYPLHLACKLNIASAIATLLEYGADPNLLCSQIDECCLSLLCRTNNLVGLESLLGAGADPNYSDRHTGQTPLHMAAAFGKVGMIRMLLRYGADLEDRDNFQRTPLFLAIEEGMIESVLELLKMGADIDVSSDGVSCYGVARAQRFGWIIRLMHAWERFWTLQHARNDSESLFMTDLNSDCCTEILGKIAEEIRLCIRKHKKYFW